MHGEERGGGKRKGTRACSIHSTDGAVRKNVRDRKNTSFFQTATNRFAVCSLNSQHHQPRHNKQAFHINIYLLTKSYLLGYTCDIVTLQPITTALNYPEILTLTHSRSLATPETPFLFGRLRLSVFDPSLSLQSATNHVVFGTQRASYCPCRELV